MRSFVARDNVSDPSACGNGSPRWEYICQSARVTVFMSAAGAEPGSASATAIVVRRALNAWRSLWVNRDDDDEDMDMDMDDDEHSERRGKGACDLS
jgi:hypothetical protein